MFGIRESAMAHKSNKKIRTLHAEKEAAEKKPEKKESQSQGQLMIAGIAAAVEKSMTTAFSAAQKEQAKVNEKVLSTLESISASQAELVSGLQELALGRLESAAVGDDEDEEADDVQAARKKQPPPEEEDDATEDDATADDATEEAAADDTVAADAVDPTSYDSTDQGDDAKPGDLNPDASSNAKSNARQGSTHMKLG